jgi:ADP-ribose pyrophosphatase YjhB (NUDIX family)
MNLTDCTPLPRAATEQDLTDLLTAHGVDVQQFGQGSAKTVSHLLRELREGEATLHLTADGKILRHALGATLHVQATDPDSGRQLTLVEDHQRFHDGRVRRRKLPGSVGEKMSPGETPEQAAVRALAEELDIHVPVELGPSTLETKTTDSQSYPGLITRYDFYHFTVTLPSEAFRPDGYVEVQSDKQTVFVWRQ